MKRANEGFTVVEVIVSVVVVALFLGIILQLYTQISSRFSLSEKRAAAFMIAGNILERYDSIEKLESLTLKCSKSGQTIEPINKTFTSSEEKEPSIGNLFIVRQGLTAEGNFSKCGGNDPLLNISTDITLSSYVDYKISPNSNKTERVARWINIH